MHKSVNVGIGQFFGENFQSVFYVSAGTEAGSLQAPEYSSVHICLGPPMKPGESNSTETRLIWYLES